MTVALPYASLTHRASHRLALGGRQRRAPWIVAGVVWNHALCSDSPEHPTDIAFHRFSEGQLCEAVELRGEACKGVIVATLLRAEQRRLHIRQRRAHPDQRRARAEHQRVAEKSIFT